MKMNISLNFGNKFPDYIVSKRDWLKSFLKEGQTRLPRKLKKKYLKSYSPLYFAIVNETQFLNRFKTDEQILKNSINNILNTPIEQRVFNPNSKISYGEIFKKATQEILDKAGVVPCTFELTDISTRALSQAEGIMFNSQMFK